jgi:hypothetical protein
MWAREATAMLPTTVEGCRRYAPFWAFREHLRFSMQRRGPRVRLAARPFKQGLRLNGGSLVLGETPPRLMGDTGSE